MTRYPDLAGSLVVCAVFLLGGCGDEDEVVKPPTTQAVCARTPDELVELFSASYAARDLETYEKILSADFLFVTASQTDQYGLDVELDITTKMFTGQQGVNGITFGHITVDRLESLTAWQETTSEDPHFDGFPDSRHRDYDVEFNFYVAGSSFRYRVRGLVRFYAVQVATGPRTCYGVLGIVDHTPRGKNWGRDAGVQQESKAVEDPSWSEVKAFFR